MIGGQERRGKSAVMILLRSEHWRYEEEKYQYECAGTIISDKHILTAAQCVHSDQNVAIGDIMVVAGENDMANLYDSNMELNPSGDASLHEVNRIMTHPNYR